jgi:hypothetical protein
MIPSRIGKLAIAAVAAALAIPGAVLGSDLPVTVKGDRREAVLIGGADPILNAFDPRKGYSARAIQVTWVIAQCG